MALYYSKCGQQLPDDANFCYKCGATLPGKSPATFGTSGVGWEYQEFSEPLGATKFIRVGYFAPMDLGPPVDEMRPLIDQAVKRILARAGGQGWEPVEPTDVISLWKAKRVDTAWRKISGWFEENVWGSAKEEITLLAVRVNCRRLRPTN